MTPAMDGASEERQRTSRRSPQVTDAGDATPVDADPAVPALEPSLVRQAAVLNRLGAQRSVVPALVRGLQRTQGNGYVQGLVRAARARKAPVVQRDDDDDDKDKDEQQQPPAQTTADGAAAAGQPPAESSQPPADAADGGGGAGAAADGQLMSIVEDFQPQEYQQLPDETNQVLYAGPDPGDGGGGGSPDGGGTADQNQAVAAPAVHFVDLGRVGTQAIGALHLAPDDTRPHAFSDGGRTGGIVWAGGGGAGPHGNQPAGSVQAQTAPTYDSRANADSHDADAWVRAGTGTISVVRSWLGANAGNQGNGHFVTAGAAARFDAHERLHVASTQGFYNTNLDPLLTRVGDHSLGLNVATTQEAAIAALRAKIKWPESVSAFQSADLGANAPMATVDTNDKASGTYPVDAGPGTVGGVAFQHRVRLPSEPNPA
jgi:hypothetical protein